MRPKTVQQEQVGTSRHREGEVVIDALIESVHGRSAKGGRKVMLGAGDYIV
jgi:hypothetical protein